MPISIDEVRRYLQKTESEHEVQMELLRRFVDSYKQNRRNMLSPEEVGIACTLLHRWRKHKKTYHKRDLYFEQIYQELCDHAAHKFFAPFGIIPQTRWADGGLPDIINRELFTVSCDRFGYADAGCRFRVKGNDGSILLATYDNVVKEYRSGVRVSVHKHYKSLVDKYKETGLPCILVRWFVCDTVVGWLADPAQQLGVDFPVISRKDGGGRHDRYRQSTGKKDNRDQENMCDIPYDHWMDPIAMAKYLGLEEYILPAYRTA